MTLVTFNYHNFKLPFHDVVVICKSFIALADIIHQNNGSIRKDIINQIKLGNKANM